MLFQPDGSRIPGMAAGKVKSQLPDLEVNNDGTSVKSMVAPDLKVSDIRKRTLVIQEQQNTNKGMQLARIACAPMEIY